ncbi:oligosaccharide flippase family protein [Lentilactobacillus sp. Marseille-Q4993]|uniref:putative polysaccharide biosynthesis protein n=1 Tax=Lentilactobacillus sp. Marseille-Q4993 TaxID=3039492 RepID=UPI0024BC8293|nr:oligosaccharide flippase family protein [Lentilactobacillus sp. Marseille-Q4993]
MSKMRNQKTKSRRQIIVAGTSMLTIAAFVAKFLSAIYRIPFQNMVGNVGFYVYQQIYPFYGIAMTIALTGLPVLISKLVVDSKNHAEQVETVRFVEKSLALVCILIFFSLQIGANFIARMMTDVQLAPVIQSVSWMFLLVPFLSSWRGYFQGNLQMIPTAVSQVFEQVIRVTVILVVAWWSAKVALEPHEMGTFAMLSAPIATVGSACLIFYYRHRVNLDFKTRPVIDKRGILKALLLEGGTICLVVSVMLLFQLVDSFSVVSGLLKYGFSMPQAQSIKGVYDRSQTLVQLGLVITTSATSAALPGLVKAINLRQDKTYRHLASSMASVNVALAVAMSIGILVLCAQVNKLLFATDEYSLTIGFYCLSILLTSIILIYNTLMQSRSTYLPSMIGIAGGLLVKILINRMFVATFSIMGASYATLIGLVVTIVIIRLIDGHNIYEYFNHRQILKIGVTGVGMGMIVDFARRIVVSILGNDTSRLSDLIQVAISVPVGVVTFFALCMWLSVFNRREWLSIPLVSKILRRRSRYENR